MSISQSQRVPLPDANWRATVPHGLPRQLYRFHEQAQDYFAFVPSAAPPPGVNPQPVFQPTPGGSPFRRPREMKMKGPPQ